MNPPPIIEAIFLLAALAIAACLASLALDMLRAWSLSRPNKRRKTHGTKVTVHEFKTQHLDP